MTGFNTHATLTFSTRCERCNASVDIKTAIEENSVYYCNKSCLKDDYFWAASPVAGRDAVLYYGDVE